MQALVWQGGQEFSMQSIPKPRAERGRVVVKVTAAAVCGSDFHLADFKEKAPLVPGHEVCGVIESCGADVLGLVPGDRVALNPVQFCGTCGCCTKGLPHLCSAYRHLGAGGVQGGWAEYVAIDAVNAHRVPDGVDDIAACLLEPMAVCYESFTRAALQPDDTVLIIGDGTFGFLHAQIAAARGVRRIIVAGHYDTRLKRIAAQVEMVPCNTHHEDLAERVREITDGHGVDVAIEATGAGSSPNAGLKALRPRGTLVIFSYVWKPEPLAMGLIHMNELNVLGSCRSLGAFDPCLELLRTQKVNTRILADVIVPFDEWPVAVNRLARDKAQVFKAVFVPRQ
jgi:threonine dehydrogenase-like Zn-dependent dehydrogenase